MRLKLEVKMFLSEHVGIIRYIAIALIALALFFIFSQGLFSASTCSPSITHSHNQTMIHPLASKLNILIKTADQHRTLPLRHLKRSLYHGEEERLKAVLLRALEGKPVKISALGGSVTQGQGLTDGGSLGISRYTERLQRFFNDGKKMQQLEWSDASD